LTARTRISLVHYFRGKGLNISPRSGGLYLLPMHARVLALTTCLFVTSLSRGWTAPSAAEELWYGKVEPLFDKHCFKCHGGVRQKGGLDLRSLENMLKGGENGPALIPGKADQSHIAQFILAGAETHMPPEKKKQLTKEEIAVVNEWITKLPPVKSVAALTDANGVAEYLAASRKLQKAAWTPPSGMAASEVIDGFISLGWRERKIKPVQLADDATFVRRVYLDVIGRIPTDAEAQEFLNDKKRDSRTRLVDKLLAQEEYGRHMAEVFDVVLMRRRGDRGERQRRENGWYTYLESAFQKNRPWNQIVREIITARPGKPEQRGADWFLFERRDSHQEMAEAVAPIAYGVQIGCAQCHNHPLASEIEQRHYWGLVAAFNRTKNVEATSGKGVAESATGGFVSFANLKKESQPALLAFLNGKMVEEKRPAEGDKEKDLPELYEIPPVKEKEKPAKPSVPKFSRRVALAEAATTGNPMLARAFVNRVWALLMGRGIVQPVDQMDSRHRASHPDLLDWLASDFEASGYDVKRLVRNIVLSRPYQLDSRWKGSNPPPVNTFARGMEKPLSAEQLFRSLLVATGQEALAKGSGKDELRLAVIGRYPDLFASEYNASLQQALFLSNSPLVDDLLKSGSASTTARLLKLPSPDARIQEAFRIVLGRMPDKDELQASKSFLAGKPEEAGMKNFVWALVASAEFQVNH
jgi:mono/diheme cytochrome c family protein